MFDNKIKKVIVDEWSGLLYERLKQLNEAYLRMHEGCNDLLEYLPLIDQAEALQKVQYKNSSFVLTYMKNILLNSQAIFPKADWRTLFDKVNALQIFLEDGTVIEDVKVKVFELRRSDSLKRQRFSLTPYFDILIKYIDEVYESLILNIQDILFLEGNIKNRS